MKTVQIKVVDAHGSVYEHEVEFEGNKMPPETDEFISEHVGGRPGDRN